MSATTTMSGKLWTGSTIVPADTGLLGAQSFAIQNSAEPTWGFTYEPDRCVLFGFGPDGAARGHDGSPVSFAAAYKVRLFSPMWELRWRRIGHEARLVVLSDDERFVDAWHALKPHDGPKLEQQAVEWLDDRYMLWGKSAARQNGWTKLTSQRIGPLWVPFADPAEPERLSVTCRQYFRVDEENYSNFVYVGERLTGFTSAND